jgi:hypothetical protein
MSPALEEPLTCCNTDLEKMVRPGGMHTDAEGHTGYGAVRPALSCTGGASCVQGGLLRRKETLVTRHQIQV